jgi:lysophospholipase L1-like esterase
LNEDRAVTFSEASINMLKETVRRLEKAGTKVIIISPPLRITSSVEKKKMFNDADVIFRSIAKEYGAIFLDTDEGMFYDNKYFTDDLHLNEPGTRIFSKQVGSILLKEIESKLPDTKRTP